MNQLMKLNLRLHEWQSRVARETRNALREHSKVVMCCPTGSGKTAITMCGVIKNHYKRVLWVTHRAFLREQAREYGHGGVTVCSVFQAIPIGVFDLVVIDEAHHAPARSYQQVFRLYPNTPVLGLTATPYRTDGQGLGACGFKKIVMSPSVYELSRDGFLAPIEDFYSDLGNIKPWPTAKVAELVTAHKEMWGFRHGIVYGRSLNENKILHRRLSKFMRAEVIDYTHPEDEVRQLLDRFKRGEVDVIINHTVLTEGYDLPELDYVLLNRHTVSRSLWRQIYGRAMRPYGDKLARVVDLAGNYLKHGRIFDDEELTLDGRFIVSRPRENPNEPKSPPASKLAVVPNAVRSVRRYSALRKRPRRYKSFANKVDIAQVWASAKNYESLADMARCIGVTYHNLYNWVSYNKPTLPPKWKLPPATKTSAMVEDFMNGEASRFPTQKSYLEAKGLNAACIFKLCRKHPEYQQLIPAHWRKKTITDRLSGLVKERTIDEFAAKYGYTRSHVVTTLRERPELKPKHWEDVRKIAKVAKHQHRFKEFPTMQAFCDAVGCASPNVIAWLKRNPHKRPSHWARKLQPPARRDSNPRPAG